jgi:Cu(I)/Ag(I) efflux system membrane fusion protein
MKHISYIYYVFIFIFLIGCNATDKKHERHDHVATTYYTCSMHPQIIEPKPGKCPICHMDLTPISLEQLEGNTIKLSDEQTLLANIQTKVIGFDNIENQIYATGVVKENEKSIQYINARVEGRVDKLNFKTTGATIKEGQVIYEIYSEMLSAAQSEFISNWSMLKNDPNDLLLKQINDNVINKLVLWGLTKGQIAELKNRDTPRIPYPITSPASGVIRKINISEGTTVMEGQNIFELADYNTLWVDAEFYANEVSGNAIGNIVQLNFDGTTQQKITGHIIEILPQVKSSSTITLVRISFESNSNAIQPGMQANVTFQKESTKSIFVPNNALLTGANEHTVWVKNSDGSYEVKMVEIGLANTSSTEIKNGLKIGDEVVISGAYLLQSEFIFKKGQNPMAGHDMSKM